MYSIGGGYLYNIIYRLENNFICSKKKKKWYTV